MNNMDDTMDLLLGALADLNYMRDNWDENRPKKEFKYLCDTIKGVENAVNSLDKLGDFD